MLIDKIWYNLENTIYNVKAKTKQNKKNNKKKQQQQQKNPGFWVRLTQIFCFGRSLFFFFFFPLIFPKIL